jgi:hypothetical protein
VETKWKKGYHSTEIYCGELVVSRYLIFSEIKDNIKLSTKI